MAIQLSFLERDVEDLLEENCGRYLGMSFIKRQLRTPVGVVDMIARHHRGLYYVIEIKKDSIDVSAFTQVLRYTKWLNSEYSKNGKRLFVPLLIGANLHSDLYAICEHFQRQYGHYDLIGRVFYALFCFDPNTGVCFTWVNSAQQEHNKKLMKRYNHAYTLWLEGGAFENGLSKVVGRSIKEDETGATNLKLIKNAEESA